MQIKQYVLLLNLSIEFQNQIGIPLLYKSDIFQQISQGMQRQNIFTGVKILTENLQDFNAFSKRQNTSQIDEFLSIKQNSIVVRNKHNYKKFKYDCCLGRNSTQQQLYDNFCLNMVEDFIQGYDCTLILCGQNKPKNSFVDIILGKDTQQTKGMLPRLIDQMATSVKYLQNRKFLLKVSFLQINQEELIDLLGVKKCKVQIKQNKSNKNHCYVNNLQIKAIQRIDQIESFYLVGNRKREYAFTKQHRKRQNSTFFFTIYLQSVEQNGSIFRSSNFTFCELAEASFEECNNNSLRKANDRLFGPKVSPANYSKDQGTLGTNVLDLSRYTFQNVINTLVYSDQYTSVPFNDSKVTKILRESLGGNCKTSILGIISTRDQVALPKILKIIRTLQIGSQIQNSPTNIKQYDTWQLYPGNQGIFNFLQQIAKLSNQLEKQKIQLQKIINSPSNYISNQIDKIKQQNGVSVIRDNQFCSDQNLQNHVIEERTKKQWELRQSIKITQKRLKQKISFIVNLQNNGSRQGQEDKLNFDQQQEIIAKRKAILVRIKNVKQKRLYLMPSLDSSQLQRQSKRQLFALQIQFQKQRNIYTSTIRDLQERLSLYRKIAQNSLKSEQIQMIRSSSKYDQTKRQFEIPMFMIKDKKIMQGNMFSPVMSERKFIISPRSSSFNSANLSNKDSQNNSKDLNKASNRVSNIKKILSRKPQKNSQHKSEYQVGYRQPKGSKQTKKPMKFNGFSKSKQLSSNKLFIAARSPAKRINNTQTDRQVISNKLKDDQHIKRVRSQYDFQKIDINRVLRYNNQRKIMRSRQKQTRSSPNLMKRQILHTEFTKANAEEANKLQSSRTKDDRFGGSGSPRAQLKRWV